MKFGDLEILSGVDLCASAGEVVGLMGANGVGKSTLLRICAGLLLPASGAALVQGLPAERARRRGWIGWSTAGEHSFQRRLSLRENLVVSARLYGLRRVDWSRRIRELSQMMGFEEQIESVADRVMRCEKGMLQPQEPRVRAA
jgi:ABC-type multidrug transport system ATPase subunit